MGELGWEAWTTMGVLGLVVGVLALTRIAPDVVMVGGLTLLLVSGILEPKEAMAGLSNEGMVTVAVLYVVVAGTRDTGAIAWIGERLLGRPKTVVRAQARMCFQVAGISAFMNNTPLVAAMVPVVADWAKKLRVPASKLMMPLSFATILGGLCTLIGTSTNVIAGGLMRDAIAQGKIEGPGFGMFTLTAVGVPAAIAGIAYMLFTSRWLLPDRNPAISHREDLRKYTLEMQVDPAGPIAGKTIEEAGLRSLPSMYVVEVERRGEIIAAVGPTLRLEGGDRLVFAGAVESVVDVQRIRGLVPATDQVFKLEGSRSRRVLVEAVVSDRCPLVGKTIKEGRFRTTYNAAVIAVARSGEHLRQKIGDIELHAGDTLLVEARPAFVEQQRQSNDFFLVSAVEDSTPPRHDRAWVSLLILLAMIVTASVFESDGFGMLHAGMLAAGLMLITRCCTSRSARRAVDWQVLLIIAAAFGLGKALDKTGAALAIANSVISVAGTHPWVVLGAMYLITMIFTEVLSNNTAITLIFPIALATSKQLGVDFMPFLAATTIAASCGFATPIGYQTNLMVYGPGGYRFTDFLRFGGILNLVVAAVVIAVTPFVFPF